MTEPKPNNIEIMFYCKTPENCVYYSECEDWGSGNCKYRDINFECHSAIAQVNALTIKANGLLKGE